MSSSITENNVAAINKSNFESNTQVSSDGPLDDSQTASDFIESQLKLEADAREALPFSFDRCTQPLGALRQNVFACLTCNPPPESSSESYTPAGVCYGCSISCHGEHTLVEIFARRNFTCDCGTTRFSKASPCTLRIDPATGMKGPVHSQEADASNTYNHNFRNRFCGCGEWYDPHKQKGTMFQCIGLATEQDSGCGEDWWHPECLLGLPRDWHVNKEAKKLSADQTSKQTSEEAQTGTDADVEDEHPVPPGFPDEEDFETLVCYKCVDANAWIKKYAGCDGFTSLQYEKIKSSEPMEVKEEDGAKASILTDTIPAAQGTYNDGASKKRKADDADASEDDAAPSKKTKLESELETIDRPLHSLLPSPPSGTFSILASDDNFRSRFCRCPQCYSALSKHPQLLEEEETYEPPISEDGGNQGGSVGTGSLLERGEAALSNVDRVRAIEGVMAYNHMKDKLKSFLQPFAESGQAVGAEDIKSYFEKLRGDNEAIKEARAVAAAGGDSPDGDGRREQSGY